jgi:hypothetical protein
MPDVIAGFQWVQEHWAKSGLTVVGVVAAVKSMFRVYDLLRKRRLWPQVVDWVNGQKGTADRIIAYSDLHQQFPRESRRILKALGSA